MVTRHPRMLIKDPFDCKGSTYQHKLMNGHNYKSIKLATKRRLKSQVFDTKLGISAVDIVVLINDQRLYETN